MADTPATSVSNSSSPPSSSYVPRYIDIGINLTDPIFTGVYHGRQVHAPDLAGVLSRARTTGCRKLLATGSDLSSSQRAVALAREHAGFVYATVGVHPCSALEFESDSTSDSDSGGAEEYLRRLGELATAPEVAAFGEIGLDYDRLALCPAAVQRTWFARQLDVAEAVGKPLFLHSRAAAADFERELFPRLHRLCAGGVVHSFTGSRDEMRRLVDNGLYIGVNGCSLKSEQNLDVVRECPLDAILLETDGPWCEIRPSHASAKYLRGLEPLVGAPAVKKEKWAEGRLVKGRNEPAAIRDVAAVVAAVKGLEASEVVEAAWRNTVKLFGLGETLDEL